MAARASYGEDRQRSELDFQSLVDLHYGTLYRFAMSLTRVESDACDLVQQTFLTWATKGHQFQAAVALFYLEDYSYNEIADILEIPLGTVKSRIARGLAQLKELVLRKAASPGKAAGGTA